MYTSFETAYESGKSHSIVLSGYDETGFEVYLTSIKDGVFGEYVSYVSSEFDEDDSLINNFLVLIERVFENSGVSEREIVLEENYNLRFTSY